METILVRNYEEYFRFLKWYEDKYNREYLVELWNPPIEYPSHVTIDVNDSDEIEITHLSIRDRIESLMQEIKTLLEFK